MRTVTNNVPRFILDSSELTAKEREQFDYLNWGKLDKGEDSASFVRYKGNILSLGDFMRSTDETDKWDGYYGISYFMAYVIKVCDDGETVIMGTMFS